MMKAVLTPNEWIERVQQDPTIISKLRQLEVWQNFKLQSLKLLVKRQETIVSSLERRLDTLKNVCCGRESTPTKVEPPIQDSHDQPECMQEIVKFYLESIGAGDDQHPAPSLFFWIAFLEQTLLSRSAAAAAASDDGLLQKDSSRVSNDMVSTWICELKQQWTSCQGDNHEQSSTTMREQRPKQDDKEMIRQVQIELDASIKSLQTKQAELQACRQEMERLQSETQEQLQAAFGENNGSCIIVLE